MHYLVCGPSGSGKSYLGSALAELKGGIFLEADLWPADGLAFHGLADAWKALRDTGQAAPLAATLDARARKLGAKFTIVALPGQEQLGLEQIRRAQGQLRIVFLYASAHHCLESFIARERRLGRHLDEAHWRAQGSIEFCRFLRTKAMQPYILRAFDLNGKRREVREMIEDLHSR